MGRIRIKPPVNPISEARRYVENARIALEENGKLDPTTGFYEDPRYVRTAGNYLWLGALLALDTVFHVRKDRRTRVDINAYLKAVSKRDQKLLAWVDNGYNIMHLYMYYDGNQDKGLCDSGFNIANEIINRCEALLKSSIVNSRPQGIAYQHESQDQQHNGYARKNGKISGVEDDKSVVLLDHASPRWGGRLDTNPQKAQSRLQQDGRGEIGSRHHDDRVENIGQNMP